MGIGIECFNAEGDKVFDNSFVTALYLGTGSTGTTAGHIDDSRIGDKKVWAVVVNHDVAAEEPKKAWIAPIFGYSHNKISWSFSPFTDSVTPVNCDFIYGVYQ